MRQIRIGHSNLRGHDRPDAWILHGAGRNITSVKLIGGSGVFAFAIGHGANQRDVLHRVGDMGPTFGDLNTTDGGGDGLGRAAVVGAGLGVKGFELAGSAAHEEQDAGHAALAQLIGVKGHGVLPA